MACNAQKTLKYCWLELPKAEDTNEMKEMQ